MTRSGPARTVVNEIANECHEAGGLPPGARLLVLARRSVSEGGRLSWCTSGRHPAAGGPSRTPRVASQRCLCRRHRRRQPVLCRHDDRCGHRLHTPTHVRSPHRLLYRRHPYGHNVIRQCASCLEFDARTASLRDRARSDRPGHHDEPAGHRPRRSSLRGPDTDPLQHPVGAGICVTISDQRLHGRPTSRPRFTGCQA